MLPEGSRPLKPSSGPVQKGETPRFRRAAQPAAATAMVTAADGGYRLRRLGPGSMTGVPAGRYTVKVMPDMDDPGAPQIPATYFRSSGLTHDVGRSSPDTYDIEISTK